MSPRRTGRERQDGQAALETMMVMSFLFLLIFGFVHMCMFAVTKSMTNYAAFAASRAMLVGGNRTVAAYQVMSEVQWWDGGVFANVARVLVQTDQQGPRLARGVRRRGVRVTYFLPFGYPVFPSGALGVVRAVGFAPTVRNSHDTIPESGDNR